MQIKVSELISKLSQQFVMRGGIALNLFNPRGAFMRVTVPVDPEYLAVLVGSKFSL
jgi:hypothetical protein